MIIRIEKNNKILYGEGVFHHNTNKTLVLCHGLNTDHNYPLMKSIYTSFQDKYNVFCFDFRGQGQSSGDFHEITLNKQIDDIQDIMMYLKETYQIDLKDITLIGHSQGGCDAMLWAARTNAHLDHLILLSPGFGIVHACQEGSFAGIPFDLATMGDHLELLLGCVLPREYIEEARQFNLEEEFKDYTYPVSIFYSPSDELVSLEDLARGTNYLKNKQMYEFDTNHHYSDKYQEVNDSIRHILEK